MTDHQYIYYWNIGNAKQLAQPFVFKLPLAPGYAGRGDFISFTADGWVTCEKGFTWNGASGPTLDTLDTVCASCGHDAMYQLIEQLLLPYKGYKNLADQWFYLRLRADGMPDFRAYYWFQGVQKFGRPIPPPDNGVRRAPLPFPSVPRGGYSPLVGPVSRA